MGVARTRMSVNSPPQIASSGDAATIGVKGAAGSGFIASTDDAADAPVRGARAALLAKASGSVLVGEGTGTA